MSRSPERSEGEGSLCLSRQTLRCAQGDSRRDMPLARRADLDRENSLSALEWRGKTPIIFFFPSSPPRRITLLVNHQNLPKPNHPPHYSPLADEKIHIPYT